MEKTGCRVVSPFDFVNAISYSKKDLIKEEPACERLTQPFVVNRALSYFPDTIMYANEVNRRQTVDNKLQNDYLLNSIRPLKRFAKWVKKVENNDFDAVQQYYGFSNEKTVQALLLLSAGQLGLIKEKLQQGGDYSGTTKHI